MAIPDLPHMTRATCLLGNRARAPRARQSDQEPSQEVLVPRWQPDAEVTFCPICATQFSKTFVSCASFFDMLIL